MIPTLLFALAAALPVDLPSGFPAWQPVGQEAYASRGPGVVLEARRVAVRVHPDVDPEIAAGEMGGLVGAVPRGSVLPGGALRFDWGDERSGATAVLLPSGVTAWLAACHWDVPARVAPARRSAARGACVEALLRGRTTPPPAAELPFTPPDGFRRGLGSTSDALYYGEGPGDVTLTAREVARPLVPGDPEELSRLTDDMVGNGVQVRDVKLVPIGDLEAVRYAGRAQMYGVTVNLIGWLLPRGRATLMIMGFSIGPLPATLEGQLEAMARGTRGLAAAPGSARRAPAAAAPPRPKRAPRAPAREERDPRPVKTWLPWMLVGGTVLVAIALGLLMARAGRRARERHRREALERARRVGGAR